MRRFFSFLLITLLVLPALTIGAIFLLSFFNSSTDTPEDFRASALLLNPPAPLYSPISLKVVTFNIQDLPLVSSNRPERMRAIAMKLLVLDPDIVGFQEAFVKKDRELLISELENTRLKHHHYFGSGIGGSGLLISSAFPIKEAYFTQFKASGPWYKLWEGDFWAGKGVGLARLELPDGKGHLDFFNTHAQAGYGNPAYDLVREDQLRQMAAFINGARTGLFPALIVGDLNCRVGSPGYTVLVEGAGLVRLMTVDSRIDHILAADDSRYTFEVRDTREIAETVSVNQKQFDLSDHKGYLSTIWISPAENAPR